MTREKEMNSKIERMKRAVANLNKVMFECQDEDIAMEFTPENVRSASAIYRQLSVNFYIKKGQVGHYFAEPKKPKDKPEIEIIK